MRDVRFSYEQMKLLLHSPAFLYPHIIPEMSFHGPREPLLKSEFTIDEDR